MLCIKISHSEGLDQFLSFEIYQTIQRIIFNKKYAPEILQRFHRTNCHKNHQPPRFHVPGLQSTPMDCDHLLWEVGCLCLVYHVYSHLEISYTVTSYRALLLPSLVKLIHLLYSTHCIINSPTLDTILYIVVMIDALSTLGKAPNGQGFLKLPA